MNITVEQFQKMIKEEGNDLEIVDVREESEFSQVRIRDSKLIPLSEIVRRVNEINWNKKVIFVCRSGARSGYAMEILKKEGKEIFNLLGGIGGLQLIQCECLEY